MGWQKGAMTYEGKSKKIFSVVGNDDLAWLEFKNDLTAFNGVKKGSFSSKGHINKVITTLIFDYLKNQGIPSHMVEDAGDHALICHKVKILPIEVVIRNRLAGSTAKRLGIEEGTSLPRPLLEFFVKSDALGDPLLTDEQALILGFIEDESLMKEIKVQAFKVNDYLKLLFSKIGLELVDFKLEFGLLPNGNLVLADEITPDSCRLWDLKTQEKMDKDRFRRDLGRVEETYAEVLKRLQAAVGS